jgi:hypothetical protein
VNKYCIFKKSICWWKSFWLNTFVKSASSVRAIIPNPAQALAQNLHHVFISIPQLLSLRICIINTHVFASWLDKEVTQIF